MLDVALLLCGRAASSLLLFYSQSTHFCLNGNNDYSDISDIA